MINVYSYKKCKCGQNRPCFNFEGEKPEYCSKCKEPGMININSKNVNVVKIDLILILKVKNLNIVVNVKNQV